MGKAMAVYEIYPEEEYDMDKLEADLKAMNPQDMKREPIAFGLELIKIAFIFDDKKDNPQDTEDALKKVPGVRDIRPGAVTLIS